jgi:hypothetical protein
LWQTYAEDRVSLSEGGAVAIHTLDSKWSLTTTGTELLEGKRYWEIELLSQRVSNILIGISTPNLDPTGKYYGVESTDGWFIHAGDGGLWGNGKQDDYEAGGYKQGDRVGVLLNPDNGSLRFFKNGIQHGPGYSAGSVTGPVVHAVQMSYKHTGVRVLPNAEAPADM